MGSINVFTGPMKCGKTKRAIEAATIQKIRGKDIKVFKPGIDNRFAENKIVTRSGKELDTLNISCIEDIEKYDADVYVIDEFQFLDGDLDAINRLANKTLTLLNSLIHSFIQQSLRIVHTVLFWLTLDIQQLLSS